MTSRGDRHRREVLLALPAPTEPDVRTTELAKATGLSLTICYNQVVKLIDEGLAERRFEEPEETPAGSLQGSRYRLTVRGLWRREGMV